MYNNSHFDQNICLRAKDTTKEKSHGFFDVVFLFPAASLLGVLHSSSFPDYIEDKKSGGQFTDRFKKCLCNDSTIIIGLAERKKRMLKTVMI
jgi:hypothetical protein